MPKKRRTEDEQSKFCPAVRRIFSKNMNAMMDHIRLSITKATQVNAVDVNGLVYQDVCQTNALMENLWNFIAEDQNSAAVNFNHGKLSVMDYAFGDHWRIVMTKPRRHQRYEM